MRKHFAVSVYDHAHGGGMVEVRSVVIEVTSLRDLVRRVLLLKSDYPLVSVR